MSVALVPLTNNEMDDSMMQEDHPADVAINIDMESPKHHESAPQPMVFADAPAGAGFWTRTTPLVASSTDELVDVEFETEGVPFEEDGMMSAAEVEMTTAPAYGEEYEYEMTYEAGQTEVNYEIEDAVVHDAEVIDAAHAHEPHVENLFTPYSHELTAQPDTTIASTVAEIAPLVEGVGAVSDATAPAEPVVEVSIINTATTEPVPEFVPELVPELLEAAVEPGVTEDTARSSVVDVATHLPVETTAEAGPEQEVAPAKQDPVSTTTTVDEVEEPVEAASLAEPTVEDPVAEITTAEETIPETTNIADATQAYEESEADTRFVAKVPPIIVTAFSGSSPTTSTPSVFTLFEKPDAASVASSSSQISDPPLILLGQHQYLFVEPIAAFLTQLRTELLQTQPGPIPPTEFEYKELQLVVRDLQLILTEDNIYSKEITLFDLESMHKRCGLTGYLHLDISLQPRFIDRYRAIRQALDARVSDYPADTAEPKQVDDTITEHGNQVHDTENEAVAQENWKHPEGEEFTAAPVQEEGDEPPLPPDDEAASSWSEEQEGDIPDGDPALPAGEGDDWEEVYESEVAPAGGEEEFVHEDEYVPPSDAVVNGGEEEAYEHDEYQQGDYNYEQGDENETHATNDHPVHVEGDELNELYAHEAEVAVTTIDSNRDEAQATTAPDTGDAEQGPTEEVAGYAGDAEEWNEEEYGGDTLDAGLPVPEEGEDQLADDSTDPLSASTGVPETHDEATNDDVTIPKVANPIRGPTPVRKRSFNEVEEEPEGELAQSPNMKKPRHS